MLVFLVSQALCAWFVFLLPGYATFKAMSNQPAAQAELQRWTVYWTVLGPILAFSHLAEWFISWFPFYWETKTIFLLFLALPQTEGSTYIYNVYLHPFLVKNEAELDASILAAQNNTVAFLQTHLAKLWDMLLGFLNKAPASGGQAASTPNGTAPTAISLDTVKGLWNSYGPAVLGALHAQSGATSSPGANSFASASSTSLQTPSGAERRVSPNASATSLPNPYEGSSPATTPSVVPPPFPVPQHN
ncbi:hypothetical protein ONZ45_g8406 [Pleurotus djamor]|nr:hypothetical protein ONZ45_g8406 [Pleurotus djamor]